MFRRRKTLQKNDRETGLAFSWRVPLSSGGSMAVAVVLVTVVALGLSAFVSVRLGRKRAQDEKRAALVIVSRENGGAWLERQAIEAGPFPVRWNPAADLAYAGLRSRALREASEVGVPYLPNLGEMDFPEAGVTAERDFRIQTLPGLPEATLRESISEGVREVNFSMRMLKSSIEMKVMHAALTLPAGETAGVVGVRYMIEFDRDGRILEVMRLDSGDPKAAMVEWVARARVSGNGGKPGWVIIESVIEP